MSTHKIAALIVAGILLLVTLAISGSLWENLEADQIMVVQSPLSGQLTWHISPGIKWQGGGSVTKYHRRSQFWFAGKGKGGNRSGDESVKVRFNDGAHATISGSLAWEMPVDDAHLNLIHTKYGSEDAIEHQLIRTILEKSLYMTGPLMSSAESYAARRNDLLGLIDDQFLRGVYKTNSRDERIDDPITGQKKTVKIVEPVKGKDGKFEREEESPLMALGINAFNLAINDIVYDPAVERQIEQQQQAVMAVQTAIAETKTAEQKALTVAAKGQADAAEAEWKQKVLTAQATALADQEKQVAVTKATQEFEVALKGGQQRLEVANLSAQEAEQIKLAAILKGEGDATARNLVMNADGALEKKLDAYKEVNRFYAEAIANFQGNLVPSVMMNGQHGAGDQAGGVVDLMNLFAAKTAKDLTLQMSIPDKSGTLPIISRPKASPYKIRPIVPAVTTPLAPQKSN